MRTFEVGKRYGEHAVVFEIVKRTAKQSHTQQYSTLEDTTREKKSQRQ